MLIVSYTAGVTLNLYANEVNWVQIRCFLNLFI